MTQPPPHDARPGPAPPNEDEHPEAHGFGSQRRRLRTELVLLAVLVLGLPLAVIAGARAGAAQLALRLPPSVDAQLGRPTWEVLKASPERCADAGAERYVEELAAPLVGALGETPFRFQFIVVAAESVNAFALPGGYVVVNSGLLESARSGEEVAAVLAHEISHVTERHSTQRLAGTLGAGAALGLLLGFVDIGAPAYTLAHLAGLRYERSQELEADQKGRALLMRAGISPGGMATFFERLQDSLAPPELLSTHPDPGDRASEARAAAATFRARVSLPPVPPVKCD
jgi:predicted Zn-dependent protease